MSDMSLEALEAYCKADVQVSMEAHAAAARAANIGGRKLASIRRIDAIDPIEGADRIVTATVDGWKVVTQKDNFKVGDLCVFFEIDSFLPVRPEFEFLRKACFKSTKNLGDGFRLKTIKLKGQISQGLVLPLSEVNFFPTLNDDGTPVITDADLPYDLTDFIGVQKWEVPTNPQQQGAPRGNFPIFIPKTDQERVQNLKKDLLKHFEEDFEITTKLDGSSMTVYRNEDGYVGVCSRNIDLKDEGDNIFWRVARSSGVVAFLQNGVDFPLAIQGALMGPGIQGNPEGLTEHNFYIFDVYHINERRYLRPGARHHLYRAMRYAGVRAYHVPILEFGKALDEIVGEGETDGGKIVAKLLELAEGPSLTEAVKREGIVFKSYNSDFTFKAIANSYLLAEAA